MLGSIGARRTVMKPPDHALAEAVQGYTIVRQPHVAAAGKQQAGRWRASPTQSADHLFR